MRTAGDRCTAFPDEGRSKADIARQLGLDRKTVRAILQAEAWHPYTRAGHRTAH